MRYHPKSATTRSVRTGIWCRSYHSNAKPYHRIFLPKEQGCVTIQHDLETLQALSQSNGHTIVARTDDRIAGYALATIPQHHRDLVPFLRPIFKEIEAVTLDGQLLRDLNYCVMGQICIAKDFRGRGVFQGLYHENVSSHEGGGI